MIRKGLSNCRAYAVFPFFLCHQDCDHWSLFLCLEEAEVALDDGMCLAGFVIVTNVCFPTSSDADVAPRLIRQMFVSMMSSLVTGWLIGCRNFTSSRSINSRAISSSTSGRSGASPAGSSSCEGCLVVRSGHGPQAEVAQGVGPGPLVEL